jgi:acetolactate synthase-1/3 small subunit
MALVKVSRGALKAAKAAAETFGARALDEGGVFELTDAPAKISSFIEAMRALGLTDVSRTGVAAISRDSD